MKKILYSLLFTVLIAGAASCGSEAIPSEILLSDGWAVQSSAETTQTGAELSTPAADTEGWYSATVPSTVMGTLTANGLYKDLLVGRNYEKASREPFDMPWWYRTEFKLPALGEGRHVSLEMDGISYRANIWLNGNLVASKDQAYGAYRRWSFDVTEYAKQDNVLAVEVFRGREGEPNIGFVDWNPRPLDESMGLFREVRVAVSGDVELRNTWVRTDVNLETLDEAWLTVETQLTNLSGREIQGEVKGRIEGLSFSVPVTLAAGEKKTVKIGPDDVAGLHMKNPRLWWSYDQGTPELYDLDLRFVSGGTVSDSEQVTFGIRQVGDYFIEGDHRGFTLNGRKVLILGGGWTDDIFLMDTPERNEQQVRYVRDMGLNTIRFEAFWGNSRNIYELCDRYGVLALVGWSCHWEWLEYIGTPDDEFGSIKTEHDMNLVARSFEDQLLWLRNSPSIMAWYAGSDKLPRPALEHRYMDILARVDPTRPYVGSATDARSTVTGPVGMKMHGPYEYVSPVYWFEDKQFGGAFGFNTETGPGPEFPTKESIERMIPADKLWPLNDTWDYHTTGGKHAFNNLDVINTAMAPKYGAARDLDDYLRKAHLMNYEATRSMFEAFRVNKGEATGVVQWMLNSAYPSVFWQLYDWYMIPVPSYYGVKNANAPLQLIYNYADNSVYAVNGTQKTENLRAVIKGWSLSGKLFEHELEAEFPADAAKLLTTVDNSARNTFLWLELYDKAGARVAGNFYVLAAQADVYDWDKTDWVGTPMKSYADFTDLQDMAPADLRISVAPEGNAFKVKLENASDITALMIELLIKDAGGEIIYPAMWSDNYVSIAPGETRTLTCLLDGPAVKGRAASLQIKGWNSAKTTFEIN